MARELSQEALLDFLCQAGGRVTNAALLSHFKSFLRDPDAPPSQRQHRRELFKGFVNSVAAVRQDPDGTKFVVLKRRYRDLLGEEGLQRPREPPAAAAPAGGAAPRGQPQPQRQRRREKEPEAEPAGAAVPAADAGCNGLSAGEGGGPRDSPSSGAPVPAAAAQAAVRCAAAETQGRCCWECLQNGLGTLPDPAAGQKPVGTPPLPGERGAPGQRRESTSAEPAPRRSPPATVGASPPALLPSADAPGERREPLSPGSPHLSTSQLQRQRTREWVARHPQRDAGPVRAWSVLPDDFLQLPSEPNPAPPPPEPPHRPRSLSAVVAKERPEFWPENPPLTVFRSIRCQLSLQDLNDFVDQESHGSEESSSGPKESPGGSEEALQVAPRTRDCSKPGSPAQHLGASPKVAATLKVAGSPRRSPQGLGDTGAGGSAQHVANGLAQHPQGPFPGPAPKLRRSLRRSSRAGRPKLSSSDEEYLEEECRKRSRRPPRSRKPSNAGAVSSPRVDAALTLNLTGLQRAVAETGRPQGAWAPNVERSAALVPSRPEHKPSLVPLDAREHAWIVMLASGSWEQVLALFWEDPQLALHKDFLTGYTALHWIAKHGALPALCGLVNAAQKAGVALDVNVRSGCGYTPLHLAAIHGHQGVIKLLVQRLASRVNIRDSSGKKPWQYLTSNTSGEIWQLLGAPRGKPIFPVYPLVRSSSPTRKAKSRAGSRNVSRKTSLAALLKSQHHKWKLANQYDKFPAPRERDSD